ncbi:hypothetical protein FRC09_002056 [Ceratobasidium sp. 395]|nr:hypothetical protein FRC09_002056 [Ceratobasidium sp. 395]
MSSAQTPGEAEGVSALSLGEDGGSVASLMSSLELVEELMRRVQRELGLPDMPLPRKHFRLMVGAGFAGLGLSVQEARRHCVSIMDEAFSEKKAFGNEVFKITRLKAAVERMLESCGVSASERMLDPEAGRPETCKVMVCVAPESGMRAGSPTCLRTYTISDTSSLPDCTIIEAICSSCALAGLFKPMDVPETRGIKSTYVGLSSFNPMVQLLDEATHLFRNEHLACVVSIGAAQRQLSATDCERVAQEMLVRFMNRPGHYFRLSVSQGMDNIKAIDWEKRSEGTVHARSYIGVQENDAIMAGIARVVLEKNKGVPMMHLRGSIPEVPSTTHTIKLCPAPSPLFVGRGDLLNRIERCLGDAQGQHVCVVHGLGGVGKTQLALKYVEMHAKDYDHLFYVDCTTKHTIDADLKRIALAKNVGDYASDALTWLARLRERWLIVYNNADDTSINLRGYFPSCSHGSILVTTRNRGVANLARGVDANCPVSSMSEDEAKELLATAAGLAQDIGSSGVALVEVFARSLVVLARILLTIDHTQMLGRFPLAIVQAGAYIQTNLCSIEEYIEMYRTSRGRILEEYANEVQKADDYELTVYATWQVSYRQLSPLARQLCDYLAYMHHDQVTEDIFRFAVLGLKDKPHALPPTDQEVRTEEMATEFLANFTRLADGTWDKTVFLRTMKDLTSYSLLTYDEANRFYSIHPLVQEWTRTGVVGTDATCNCVAFLLASSVIWEYKTEDYAHRRVLLSHVDCLPDSEKLKPRLAWRLGLVYAEAGRTKDEERLAKAEYEANLKALGRDNPWTLTSMGSLATAYRNQGRWEEAEVLQREALELRKRASGDEHPSTLTAMANLATTYRDQGRWREAEVLHLEVVTTSKRVSGDEHPRTLRAMAALAVTYSSQGRWGEAEVLGQEVVEIRKRVSGDKHPDTLKVIANLAVVYLNQGRWGEAEALEREVVEVGKRVWGDEHPETLAAMGNLAATYLRQGRLGEAEVLQREVLEVRKRTSGDERPSILVAMGNLAATYGSQRRWGEAEVLQREEVEARKRLSGSEHPDTLIAMGNLAATYLGQRRWADAEVLQREVLEVRKRASGVGHPSTLTAMGNLAATYSRQGRWREAEVLQRAEVEARKRASGDEHPDTLTAMGNLAATYSGQERWAEAEVLRRKVAEGVRRVWGDEHPRALKATETLAATYLSQGRWAEADVLLREVLEVAKRIWGDEHPQTLAAMGSLVVAYERQGRWEEVEVLQREVLELRKRASGDEHPGTLMAMGSLAATYYSQGRWGEAEVLLREVVEVGKRVWGDEHPETLAAMGDLAAAYEKQGRWTEAEVLLRAVVEVKRRAPGDGHPDTLTAMGNLALTYNSQGRWAEAEALLREVVEVRKQVSGDEHPDTLIATGNLAGTYWSQGRWGDAEVLLQEVVDVGRRVWGNEHPDTLHWTSWLKLVQSHLTQPDIPEASLSAEADPSTQLLETSSLETAQAAETPDNVQPKPEGRALVAGHHRRLILWSLFVALVCCFFSAIPFGRLLQILMHNRPT